MFLFHLENLFHVVTIITFQEFPIAKVFFFENFPNLLIVDFTFHRATFL